MLFHNFELMNCDKICRFDSSVESVFLSPLMCYMREGGGGCIYHFWDINIDFYDCNVYT